jgi:hypothetical protein
MLKVIIFSQIQSLWNFMIGIWNRRFTSNRQYQNQSGLINILFVTGVQVHNLPLYDI